jgi:hypothetical protein
MGFQIGFQMDGNVSTTARQMLRQMSESVTANLKPAVELHLRKEAKLTPEERKRALDHLDEEVAAALPVMKAVFEDPALVAELELRLSTLYAKHFTPEELTQLAAFYQTPVGQKLLKHSEPMMRDMEQALSAVQASVFARTRALAQELLERLKKR